MPVKEAIKERLEVLNKILLSEITHNEKDYDASAKLIEGFIEDRAKFMNNTRLAYKISHPGFIKYLEDRNLTEDEINLMCLYAMGMIGKEVTSYTKKNGHYNVGSRIGKRLGLSQTLPSYPYISRIFARSSDLSRSREGWFRVP